MDTLSILDEIENVLKISAYPMNWPLGCGADFKGVWERKSGLVHLFERTVGGAFRAPVLTRGITDPTVRDLLDKNTYDTICEEVEMVEHVGVKFDPQDVFDGKQHRFFSAVLQIISVFSCFSMALSSIHHHRLQELLRLKLSPRIHLNFQDLSLKFRQTLIHNIVTGWLLSGLSPVNLHVICRLFMYGQENGCVSPIPTRFSGVSECQ